MSRGFVITQSGKKLLAELVITGELNITRVMVGKGELQQGQSPEYFTDLIEPVTQATSSIPVVKNGVISFVVEYRNDLNGGLQEGFWLKEFGVFARDGENEILLYYASLGEYPQYVEAYENGKVNIKKYPVSILVTDDIKVTIAYAALAFVTEQRMKEFVEIEALPYLESVLAESENNILSELNKKADRQTVEQALDTKADAEIIQQALDQKANAQEVQIALDKKADKETVTEELAKKANTETMQEELNKKADTETMQQALDQKANEMEMLQKLSEKADKEAMITELAIKADKEDVQTELDKKVDKEEIEELLQQQIDGANIALELDKKADKETVVEELAKKADAETMQEELNKKADMEAIQQALEQKADNETIQVELAKKSDTETVQRKLEQKADNETITAELAKKAEKEHKHSTDDITSGTLPVARGGTGNATGNAATATKLQTARTLALSGDVTGSTAFDGSANKTIAATLANSGVTAGTYGALDLVTKNNGTVWVSNNTGLHGTSAISTWTAKQACKLSFRWRVSGETNCDYLTITAGGTEILAKTSTPEEQTGTLTATLAANQTIVFRFRKDGSVNKGLDRAEISEVKYGASTADPTVVLFDSNIESYFEIENKEYGFYPAVVIPNITVDTKGRLTKVQNVCVSSVVQKRHTNGTTKEGRNTTASGKYSHAEGRNTIASGYYSHAEGYESIAESDSSHAEGTSTKTLGIANHTEGSHTVSVGAAAHAEGYGSLISEDIIEIKSTTTNTITFNTTDNISSATFNKLGSGSKIGIVNYSYYDNDVVYATITSVDTTNKKVTLNQNLPTSNFTPYFAFAIPTVNVTSCKAAHAEGYFTIAAKTAAHTEGYFTIAGGNYQTVMGQLNKISTTSNDKLIIGNGSTPNARSNCLRVTNTNGVYSNSTFKSSGADYAEMFEWLDGNADKKERTGLFVTLEGEKIRIATPEDDYILGIVSACPSVCGDVRDDTWGNMHLTTLFGEPILEEVEIPERTEEIMTINEEGEEVTETIVTQQAHTEIRQKLNPEYDNTKEYIPRSERPEWDAVGILGKLVAIDDGSCEENGWCKVGEGGIATISEQKTRFRVMKRLDKNHIKLLIL